MSSSSSLLIKLPKVSQLLTHHICVIFKFVPQVNVLNKIPTFLLWIPPRHVGTDWTHLKNTNQTLWLLHVIFKPAVATFKETKPALITSPLLLSVILQGRSNQIAPLSSMCPHKMARLGMISKYLETIHFSFPNLIS